MFNQDFNQNLYGEDINVDIDMNVTNDMNKQVSIPFQGNINQPVIEPMQERIVNRTIMHEVPHVCPFMYDLINN